MSELSICGNIFICLDLLFCYICLLGSSTWRQSLISLLVFPTFILGCAWLCAVCHTEIGKLIAAFFNMLAVSLWLYKMDEYRIAQRRKEREKESTFAK
jgi:hypothetical protein